MAKENFNTDDLTNLSEELVFEQIQQLIDEGNTDVPTSDISIQDVAAIALNNIPPKYICSLIDKVDPREELRRDLMDLRKYARRQVLKAISIVNKNPHD
ncbi:MAG: aminoglycoside phosphotransferase [Gammaproteobacteria bacterium CG22_combo_CG10-13_8_21_14_all_40_8]|nr:MAG: aminoglycoside phosphotransferase [Gammaproteobacteria bacterium CG22_combo_CG10-13_8_21_14_all_40_8]